MKNAMLNIYLVAAVVTAVIVALVWFYRPYAQRMIITSGPQSQQDLLQIKSCLSQIPSYSTLYLADRQTAAIHPEQMLIGPFVALSTMNTDFYTGAITMSLESTTEETDMWIGKLGGGASAVGAVVVGQDGDGFECVSLQEAAIGSALDQFGSEDRMIWDAEGNAYFKLTGTTVVPLGTAAHDLTSGNASLRELQEAMLERPKE